MPAFPVVLQTFSPPTAVPAPLRPLRLESWNSLERLPVLTDPARIAQLVADQAERDLNAVARAVASISNPDVLAVVLDSSIPSWMYGASPMRWQSEAFLALFRKRAGFKVWANSIWNFIAENYPYDTDLWALHHQQHMGRHHLASVMKDDAPVYWVGFSPEENGVIPDFYLPMRHMVERLSQRGLIYLDRPISGSWRAKVDLR